MKPPAMCTVALFILGNALVVMAHAEQPTYRDPGDMSEQERGQLMAKTNAYNKCVYKEAMARVDALPDIRQAADQGMAACKPVIEELKSLAATAGFDPGFGEHFARSAQNRVVKMLFPELALRKSGH